MHLNPHIKVSRLAAVLTTCLLALLSHANSSQADTYRSNPQQGFGEWSDLNDWQIEGPPGTWTTPSIAQGAPGAGDCATVRTFHVMTIDQDVTLASLTIDARGLVDFDGDFTLSVTGAGGLTVERVDGLIPGLLDINVSASRVTLSGGGSHRIDGDIRLSANPCYLRIDDAPSTLDGSGTVFLTDRGARVEIEDSVRLTIGATSTMSGIGTITCYTENGHAYLKNLGVLEADGGGSLTLEFDLTLEDGAGAEWRASGGANTLRLNAGHEDTCLAGDFTVWMGGCIDTAANVIIYTTGTFTCNVGGCVGAIYYDCDCGDVSTCTPASGC